MKYVVYYQEINGQRHLKEFPGEVEGLVWIRDNWDKISHYTDGQIGVGTFLTNRVSYDELYSVKCQLEESQKKGPVV